MIDISALDTRGGGGRGGQGLERTRLINFTVLTKVKSDNVIYTQLTDTF